MRSSYLLVSLILISSIGCMKPYDQPEFEEIGTSETAFLIPFSDAAKQQSFDSEESLKKNIIFTKRVQIPHEWVQTGRMWTSGHYQDTLKVITVDRAPQTREWSADSNSGTSSRNEALWAESFDSVGFSTGINCTARIPDDESAIKFLFNYPALDEGNDTGLASIMDKEVRTEIQTRISQFSSLYTMDQLRAEKNAMIDYVKEGVVPEEFTGKLKLEGVVPFFKERGVEITNIGQFGGFTYENKEIQNSIDKVFQAQQDEEVAKAESLAQRERNESVKLAAEGLAEAVKLKASGEAEAIKTVADAKAYEIEKAQQNWEQYVSLKQLEIEQERLEKWDGSYPASYIGQALGGLTDITIMKSDK